MSTDRTAIRRRLFCCGCGTHWCVHGEHRADCTAPPGVRLRLLVGSHPEAVTQ